MLGRNREWPTDTGRRARVNEKNTIMTPFTIIDKLTGPYAFSRTNKESLNTKAEMYFHDIAFVPLFMQVSAARVCAAPRSDGTWLMW